MFMNPAQMLAACNLQTTDAVADFGAGSGFLSKAAAALVPQGSVFAIEIHREIVTRLARDAEESHLDNLHVLWGDIELPGGTRLDNESVNFVIISNVLFHLDDKIACINEAKRILKPGGRLLVVDWSESFAGLGPQPSAVVNKQMAEELCARAGLAKVSDTLPAGDHHYAILFKK
ncbi:MAG TPA: class I SAM-dependent methyltransferase [Candidatus Paceibacterota bacterium]|jgi:SAM-dependent methyltransferase|nr:class I SAM-dependent methyltransferase [Candidatus Paceibacterota bacterium]